MKKTTLTINTKIKYIDSPNYQKHFTLDDRIKIQKIIFEHRDDNGKLTIMLKLLLFIFSYPWTSIYANPILSEYKLSLIIILI